MQQYTTDSPSKVTNAEVFAAVLNNCSPDSGACRRCSPLFRNCSQLFQWSTDWKLAPGNLCKKELSGRISTVGLHFFPERALLVILTLVSLSPCHRHPVAFNSSA